MIPISFIPLESQQNSPAKCVEFICAVNVTCDVSVDEEIL